MLTGTFRCFFIYDIAEEIDLDELRRLLGLEKPAREPSFRHLSPEYVRFERPPVVHSIPSLRWEGSQEFQARMKYFDYGVASIELIYPFSLDWSGLVSLSSNWVAAAAIEKLALDAVTKQVARTRQALRRPIDEWLSEDYNIIEITQAAAESGEILSAPQLLERYGDRIAQIVRGEAQALSAGEQAEVLASSLSYYPTDLLVAGWVAAFVYDTAPEGSAPTIQLLEYANTQLLEFRYYDVVLTRVLSRVYDDFEHRGSFWSRWRLAQQARRLNTILLDVTELSERVDNAIKFLSDMFYARAYRLAAARIGVPDYRRLVDGKLRTAGELYGFMMDQFHESRAFVLELMIVIILIIDLFFLFRGKS